MPQITKSGKNKKHQLDIEDTSFADRIEAEFNYYNNLIRLEPEFNPKKPILRGKEQRDKKKELKIQLLPQLVLFELEEKLGSTEKGLHLLAAMTTDWDIQAIEFKKLIQLVKEGLPKSVAQKQGQSRSMFDSIHAWITRNSRAKT